VRSNALPTFERTSYLWSNGRVHVRPQITAAAARADMGVRLTAEHLRSNADNC
jgi:hypothetical protein